MNLVHLYLKEILKKLVKEEVGLRSAQIIVQTVNPDASIVLEEI
jgi:putative aminopeptidase FrvX